MPHVPVDVGEDGVAAPRGHQQPEGDGEGEPVRGEEVGRGWVAEGSWVVWFDEAVDEEDEDD